MNDAIDRDEVRSFIASLFTMELQAIGVQDAVLADDFDLLIEGVMDSLGLLELIAALDERFGVMLDLEALDAEDITKVGSLADAVVQQASLPR